LEVDTWDSVYENSLAAMQECETLKQQLEGIKEVVSPHSSASKASQKALGSSGRYATGKKAKNFVVNGVPKHMANIASRAIFIMDSPPSERVQFGNLEYVEGTPWKEDEVFLYKKGASPIQSVLVAFSASVPAKHTEIVGKLNTQENKLSRGFYDHLAVNGDDLTAALNLVTIKKPADLNNLPPVQVCNRMHTLRYGVKSLGYFCAPMFIHASSERLAIVLVEIWTVLEKLKINSPNIEKLNDYLEDKKCLKVQYTTAILDPGDCLYVPGGVAALPCGQTEYVACTVYPWVFSKQVCEDEVSSKAISTHISKFLKAVSGRDALFTPTWNAWTALPDTDATAPWNSEDKAVDGGD